MAGCCTPSPRVLLPFLYPTIFSANGKHLGRVCVAAARARNGSKRCSSSSTSTSSDASPTGVSSRLNPTPDDYAQPYFADKAKLTIQAGPGGQGCISFLREAYMPEGPANGGDGGHGGNVYIQAVRGETSLHKLTRRRFVRAGKGKTGMGGARSGQRGDDVVITVPVGTVLTEISRSDPEAENAFYYTSRQEKKLRKASSEAADAESAAEEENRDMWVLYPGISSSEAKRITLPELPYRDRLFFQPKAPVHLDLSKPTPRPILLVAGGLGGLGNPHFVSKERPRPLFATKGEQAMSMQVELELKLLADVGLVGLPNAGKSTLLRALTNSRARVGNWAFTTLQPNIGTVVLDNNKGRPSVTSFRRQPDAASELDPFSLSADGTTEPKELERRTRFTIADIPGLIEGAHLDKGLGMEFLRHVERAGVLAFVIDLGAGDAVQALKALWNEVGLYAQMREEEEHDRERDARIDYSAEAGTNETDNSWPIVPAMADYPAPEPEPTGLSIAAKPWFVVATKGDLPNTRDNFKKLRDYLESINRGDEEHPSGVEGAWTRNCRAIPVSAINGHGVDRIVHWTVGLLDGSSQKNRGGRGGGAGGRDNRANHRPYQSFPEVKKENAKFEKYYNDLLRLPEEEQAEFWAALKRELPNSFRFCGSKGHALAVKRLLQTRYIPEITRIHHDGVLVDPPKAVPWYPDGLAWWMTTPKNVIRKFPPFSAFQKFLVSETSVGNISRQELVSMIPPLLMDLRPGMTVLDLCAAPGSKSAQLLEMIHRGEEARIRQVIRGLSGTDSEKTEEELEEEASRLEADPSDDGRATGILIANDADYKRSHMLIHQLKRLSSPNMIVTNHDATMYPPIRISNPEDPNKPKYLKFDRILADVPCSGDGTLRKNVNIWKDWSPSNALGLHLTQVRILVRALQMLKPGGRVVYSTCSMNPIENESVVAAAIERCGGPEKIEIIDCSDQLPLLKRKPGLKQWQVMDKSGRVWNSWQEVEEHVKGEGEGIVPSRLVETMFPAPEGNECHDLPLDRCMRVYAHQQDTGGFFITALHKKAEFKAKPEDAIRKAQPTAAATTADDANGTSAPKREREDEQVEKPEAKKRRISEEPANGATPTQETAPTPTIKSEPVTVAAETNGQNTEAKNGTTNDKTEVKLELDADAESAPVTADEPMTDAVATETSVPTPKTEPTSSEAKPALPERKRKQEGPYEEPFKYLKPDHDVINNVTEFYGISPRFPRDRYMVRNAMGEPAKAIYYTSALIRDILVHNEGRGVKFIHGGVKMFVKQDAPSADVCRWRIQSEGMPILHGYVGEERVVVLHKKETFKKLLIEMFPKISNGEWARLDEIGERVRDLKLGCCVLRIQPDEGDEDFNETMALPLWKSVHSLNLMLPKEDRSAMLLRIYNDTTPLINMGIKKDEVMGDAGDLPAEDGPTVKAE
ncbi:mitochondrial GTPase [Echria macrotheca]|uniref:Mitochondrial GTPase n=1 Tax=Echria macrotheca TaxID=438768 RepID=A0AAJ0BCK4_9PEZI|nr:mitochondrial GTPase [Echria macrotheca]